MLYLLIRQFIVAPFVKLFFRPKVTGLHHIPTDGPALLVSNHLAFSDSIFLPVAVPRQIVFPAKSEYFTAPGLKGKLMATFFRSIGQIPIDRSGGRASLAALNTGLDILKKGQLFGIYPEGTRSPDGRLYKGKTGVARMAIVAGVPVIPVAMIDTHKLQPPGSILPKVWRREPGKLFPRMNRPGVAVGEPLDFSRYEGMERDRFVLRSVTDEIMYALMDLSGQEYVDMYADKAKELIKAGESVDDHLRLGDTKAS
ncbi:lysophospholipid acyltransferase family protein [Kribbella albertanoniae]|uniref:1-acyl-sn-glycerol-3-phosphate acyltransferase n=1 Tax=Kribbella albertanoniae TaxID=1266829 RepID=A0A4R4PMR1_9ACTN|nr:lysophospholipid acyltransferase family protein [Kribbella albertanoniae]TDC23477.1 1-acyl-sn-glycerol-3-phosphate acyltransferase [Kribbella albertanoniae]